MMELLKYIARVSAIILMHIKDEKQIVLIVHYFVRTLVSTTTLYIYLMDIKIVLRSLPTLLLHVSKVMHVI